jgi:ATP-dependent helicase/DNAse subunit B
MVQFVYTTTTMTVQLGKYKLPEHISYSALTTYIDCGYQYYLGRLLEIPEQPSVWSVGGSSFHTATEKWDYENC